MIITTYEFTADYKTDMHRHIDVLFSDKLSTRQQRLDSSDSLIESYVVHADERPDGTALERLATLILRDELTDPDSHKVSREPEPILSQSQQRRRRVNESLSHFGEDDSDEENTEYHSEITRGLAADGRSYRKPIRRTRSIWELIRMDSERNR